MDSLVLLKKKKNVNYLEVYQLLSTFANEIKTV